ncbi:MAG TPA: hypothetical protein VNN22_20555 [Verrucomicrobiae bacterium]|nr:hypothetical protein [Verrucomicrobiae bacterium]
MFKQVVDAARQTLFLVRDVDQAKQDIATLKEEVALLKEQLGETNQLVRQLAFELQRSIENERQERGKFILRVENILLRERQLPPARSRKKRK